MLDAVFSGGGAPENALIRASRKAPSHSPHSDPAIAPSANVCSKNARLSELTNEFAQPEESFRVGRSSPIAPFVPKSVGPANRGKLILPRKLMLESVIVNITFQLGECFDVVLATFRETEIETSGAQLILLDLLILRVEMRIEAALIPICPFVPSDELARLGEKSL